MNCSLLCFYRCFHKATLYHTSESFRLFQIVASGFGLETHYVSSQTSQSLAFSLLLHFRYLRLLGTLAK